MTSKVSNAMEFNDISLWVYESYFDTSRSTIQVTFIYSKTCLKRPLKIDKIKVLMENGSLMKVESIAECLEHSAILLTCIKR